jgi:mRNA interferase RelE/StbE
MGSYRIFIRKLASDELTRIPKKDGERIIERIRSLSTDPRPRGCRKLSAREIYRLRQGDYRIVYIVDDEIHTVQIEKIGHRREIYRTL